MTRLLLLLVACETPTVAEVTVREAQTGGSLRGADGAPGSTGEVPNVGARQPVSVSNGVATLTPGSCTEGQVLTGSGGCSALSGVAPLEAGNPNVVVSGTDISLDLMTRASPGDHNHAGEAWSGDGEQALPPDVAGLALINLRDEVGLASTESAAAVVGFVSAPADGVLRAGLIGRSVAAVNPVGVLGQAEGSAARGVAGLASGANASGVHGIVTGPEPNASGVDAYAADTVTTALRATTVAGGTALRVLSGTTDFSAQHGVGLPITYRHASGSVTCLPEEIALAGSCGGAGSALRTACLTRQGGACVDDKGVAIGYRCDGTGVFDATAVCMVAR